MANQPHSGLTGQLAKAGAFMPQESMLEVKKGKHRLFIGIPRETSYQENRIALVPESVALLVNNGHEVVLETAAGKNANFQDNEYSEAGARIAYSPEEIYKADIILKVAPPSAKEVGMLQHKQTLISILQISTQPENYIKTLAEKKLNAIAFEYIQDKSGVYPVVKAMSEIVGSASILIAAEYLSNINHGKGELLGGVPGVPPSQVVILGAGTVAEYAARAALGLGAQVKIFDNSLYKLRRIQNNLGVRIYTSTIIPKVLMKALKTADVSVGALQSKNGRTPVVVTDEMVGEMKAGSVIIDVSIDQGGCFETSHVTNHTEPVFKKYGVVHYCVPNIASRVSRTASYALSNIFTPALLAIAEEGGIEEMLWKDPSVRNGVYLYKGNVTNKLIANISRLPFKDLDLLMAARI
jgi:alanine dehydrogenase